MNFEMKNKNFQKALNRNEFCFDFLDQNAANEIVSNEPLSGQLSVEIEAKRPGRKGAAQTPSSPSERKSGSSKNKPGSAGQKSDNAISFSNKVVEALKNKVKDHNAKQSRKVTLSQLKKVYRRGAGAFSSSHRPGMTRGQWAMARVNMFLRMMAGGKVKDSYRKADQDVSKAFVRVIDVSDSWEPEDQDLTQASLDVLEIGEFDFDSVDELYLDEETISEKWYEI
jgi:hypothetical protein